jgi:hypothetical protein
MMSFLASVFSNLLVLCIFVAAGLLLTMGMLGVH